LHERTAQARFALDPVEVETADVAHPEVVDVWVVARCRTHDLRALRPFGLRLDPERRVAAALALRADGVDGERVVPGPRTEAVVARGDGADRTHVHEVAREQRVHALFLERRDLAAVPAVDDADLRVAVDLAHEAHAARA